MKKHFKIEYIGVFIVFLAILIWSLYFGYQKKGYQVDEMYSYGLANSNYRPFPNLGDTGEYDMDDFMQEYGAGNNVIDLLRNLWKDCGIISKAKFHIKTTELYSALKKAQETHYDMSTITWRSGEFFQDYLTVEKGTGFNYASVYFNQRSDVHPPFYYILLHTISSIFTGKFSKWFAFSINIVALFITAILLYKLVRKVAGNYLIALSTVMVYGFSTGYVSTLTFFRMYALLTLMTVAFCYIHQCLREQDWILNRKRKRQLIIITVLGYYTQYYFLIYAAAVVLTVMIYFIYTKRYKLIWPYFRQFLWAALCGIVIWPSGIRHIFFGYRGAEAGNSLLHAGSRLKACKEMFDGMRNAMFGESSIWMYLVLFFGILTFIVYIIRKRRNQGNSSIIRYILLFIPAGLYFVLVSIVSPYSSDRYIMNIMPFASILTTLSLFYLIKIVIRNKKLAIFVLTLSFIEAWVVASAMLHPSGYLKGSEQEQEKLPSKTVCVYVMPDGHYAEYMKDLTIFAKCKSVVILYESNLAFLEDYQYEEGDTILFYLAPGTNIETDIATMTDNMGIGNLQLTKSTMDATYYRIFMYQ